MTSSQEDILRRLLTLRRRVRALLVVHGAAVLIVQMLPAVLAFAILDWWVHFPNLVRLAALAIAVGWTAAWIARRIIRPIMAPLPLEQLALRLGTLSETNRDALAGAVSFLDGHGSGSAELWQRVIDESTQNAPREAWTRGLHTRSILVAALPATLLLAGVGWLHVREPDMCEIGRARLLAPWVSAEWPRRVRIMPLTTDVTVALGESVTLSMRVERGDHAYLRGYVDWGPKGGLVRRSLMQREADGIFRFTLENVRATATYAFAAGDDDTRDSPFRVTVVRRPELQSARLVLYPPVYARVATSQTFVLGSEPVSAVRGSAARVEVTARESDGELALVSSGRLDFTDGWTIGLLRDEQRSGILAAEFLVTQSGQFHVTLIGAGDLESRGDRAFELIARDDAPPVIEIVSPQGDVDMTPRGVVEVRIRAEDDFGIETLQIVAGADASIMQPVANVLHGSVTDADSPGSESMEPPAPARRVDQTVRLRVRSMHPAAEPGDTVTYAALCADVFESDGTRRDPVRSTVRRIRIVSEAQFAEWLRQSLSVAGSQLHRLAAEIDSARSELARLDEGPAAGAPLDDAKRRKADQISRDLRQAESAARALSEQLQDLIGRAEQNHTSGSDAALQAGRLERGLRRLAREELREASNAAHEASTSDDPAKQHESLDLSQAATEQAVEEMRSMLASLARWNEFADIARNLREMLDRQEDLSRVCARHFRDFGGQTLDELSEPQQASLRAARRTQGNLLGDAELLLRSMADATAALEWTDRASSETLRRASAIAGEMSLIERMSHAATEIDENRLRGAIAAQQEALTALRAMIAAFEARADRELAMLARSAADLAVSVERLIRAQDDLIEHTRAASGDESRADWPQWADRQKTLARTAEGVAEKVREAGPEAFSAIFALLTAVAHMEAAADHFEQSAADAAVDEQESARTMLVEALETLREMQEQSERQMAERSLEAILEMLAGLRDAQAGLRGETATVIEQIGTSDRVGRTESLKLASLAIRQGDLKSPLHDVTERLQSSLVVKHVLDRVGGLVESASERLTLREPVAALVLQGRILNELERLIGAIESHPGKDRDRFVQETEGGGGSAGEPTLSRPVPPLAELKVLRMLQGDLNARTRELDAAATDPMRRSEGQLSEAVRLGREQAALRELAIQMMRKAQDDAE